MVYKFAHKGIFELHTMIIFKVNRLIFVKIYPILDVLLI